MKYFIYTRKSTDSEERQILSIESQLSELKEFAAKEKLEIVASLCEAKTAKEPEIISARTSFWAKSGLPSFLIEENQDTCQYRDVSSRQPTQDALAKTANIPYTTIAKIESDVIKNPSLQTITKIAEGLGMTIDDLVKN